MTSKELPPITPRRDYTLKGQLNSTEHATLDPLTFFFSVHANPRDTVPVFEVTSPLAISIVSTEEKTFKIRLSKENTSLLKPKTQYYYELSMQDATGEHVNVAEGTFSTTNLPLKP